MNVVDATKGDVAVSRLDKPEGAYEQMICQLVLNDLHELVNRQATFLFASDNQFSDL